MLGPQHTGVPDTPSLQGSWTGQRTLGGPDFEQGTSRGLLRKYELKLWSSEVRGRVGL